MATAEYDPLEDVADGTTVAQQDLDKMARVTQARQLAVEKTLEEEELRRRRRLEAEDVPLPQKDGVAVATDPALNTGNRRTSEEEDLAADTGQDLDTQIDVTIDDEAPVPEPADKPDPTSQVERGQPPNPNAIRTVEYRVPGAPDDTPPIKIKGRPFEIDKITQKLDTMATRSSGLDTLTSLAQNKVVMSCGLPVDPAKKITSFPARTTGNASRDTIAMVRGLTRAEAILETGVEPGRGGMTPAAELQTNLNIDAAVEARVAAFCHEPKPDKKNGLWRTYGEDNPGLARSFLQGHRKPDTNAMFPSKETRLLSGMAAVAGAYAYSARGQDTQATFLQEIKEYRDLMRDPNLDEAMKTAMQDDLARMNEGMDREAVAKLFEVDGKSFMPAGGIDRPTIADQETLNEMRGFYGDARALFGNDFAFGDQYMLGADGRDYPVNPRGVMLNGRDPAEPIPLEAEEATPPVAGAQENQALEADDGAQLQRTGVVSPTSDVGLPSEEATELGDNDADPAVVDPAVVDPAQSETQLQEHVGELAGSLDEEYIAQIEEDGLLDGHTADDQPTGPDARDDDDAEFVGTELDASENGVVLPSAQSDDGATGVEKTENDASGDPTAKTDQVQRRRATTRVGGPG